MASNKIDGHHVLYHYLQKNLQQEDDGLFRAVVARLIDNLAIWFSPETYRAMPILIPFAIRDPKVRGDKKRGIPDQWGAPNPAGYLRDDNSLIKGIPRSLRIVGSNALYRGRRLGNGFVACHVWRELASNPESVAVASRHPLTYSFVPNLVWLPVQVAKLTDREGSFAQRYLQAHSLRLYRDVSFEGRLRDWVEAAWALLPEPQTSDLPLPSTFSPSMFAHDPKLVERRKKTAQDVAVALLARAAGQPIVGKVVTSRYTEGLSALPSEVLLKLASSLEDYLSALRDEWGAKGRLVSREIP